MERRRDSGTPISILCDTSALAATLQAVLHQTPTTKTALPDSHQRAHPNCSLVNVPTAWPYSPMCFHALGFGESSTMIDDCLWFWLNDPFVSCKEKWLFSLNSIYGFSKRCMMLQKTRNVYINVIGMKNFLIPGKLNLSNPDLNLLPLKAVHLTYLRKMAGSKCATVL